MMELVEPCCWMTVLPLLAVVILIPVSLQHLLNLVREGGGEGGGAIFLVKQYHCKSSKLRLSDSS